MWFSYELLYLCIIYEDGMSNVYVYMYVDMWASTLYRHKVCRTETKSRQKHFPLHLFFLFSCQLSIFKWPEGYEYEKCWKRGNIVLFLKHFSAASLLCCSICFHWKPMYIFAYVRHRIEFILRTDLQIDVEFSDVNRFQFAYCQSQQYQFPTANCTCVPDHRSYYFFRYMTERTMRTKN